jgi:hypothetical protein
MGLGAWCVQDRNHLLSYYSGDWRLVTPALLLPIHGENTPASAGDTADKLIAGCLFLDLSGHSNIGKPVNISTTSALFVFKALPVECLALSIV